MKTRLGQSVATAIAASLALAGSAAAAELDYNYAELRYIDTELFDTDGDGFEIGGSLELTPSVHLFGNFQTLDFGPVDRSAFKVGGGYAMPLNPGTDLVARLFYVDGEIDPPGPGDLDDSGFGFSAGSRTMFTPRIEGRAFVNYADLDTTGDEISFELAGDFFLNDQVAVGASLELGDDVTSWTIGARWFFGRTRR